MIARRTLLLSGLAATMVPQARAAGMPAGVPPGGRIAFEAFRNNSRIGTHTLDFNSQGDRLAVRIDIRFAVGLGPFTFYRYTMQGTEQWAGGRFVALDTETDDDGTACQLSVRRTASGLALRVPGQPERQLPEVSLPLTHWTVATMSAPVFNPQDGKPIADRATPLGPEPVMLLDGRTVPARSYRLSGELALQDWYDESQLWVKLRAKAKDGSDIDYRRVS